MHLCTHSLLNSDESPTLDTARGILALHHPITPPPTLSDLVLVRHLSDLVATRSAALVASAIYALWALRRDECAAAAAAAASASSITTTTTTTASTELALAKTVVACNGAVIELYPGYRAACQRFLDELVREHGDGDGDGANGQRFSVELVAANESSLLGAAVAAACQAEAVGSAMPVE